MCIGVYRVFCTWNVQGPIMGLQSNHSLLLIAYRGVVVARNEDRVIRHSFHWKCVHLSLSNDGVYVLLLCPGKSNFGALSS